MLDALFEAIAWFVMELVFYGIFYPIGWLMLKVLTFGRYPPSAPASHNRDFVAAFPLLPLLLAFTVKFSYGP